MDLRSTYAAITEIQFDLQAKLEAGAFFELKKPWDLRSLPDDKVIQAMAATFALQEYIASEIAKNESRIEDLQEQIQKLDPEKDAWYIKKSLKEIADLQLQNGEQQKGEVF